MIGWIRRRHRAILLAGIISSACSASSDEGIITPVVVRVDPDTASIGEAMTVFGTGFSEIQDNIVLVGGIAIVDTEWQLADTGQAGEEEQIAFTLSDDIETGTQDVLIISGSEISNSVTVTVTE